MRNRRVLIGTLAIAAVALAIGAVALALHTRSDAQAASLPGLHSRVSAVCPGATYQTTSGQGDPAIRPRNGCTPSFTEQDVRDYLAHAVSLGKIAVFGRSTVTRVVFLTIRDLGRASGDGEWEANYPADMVVCYVGLGGTFRVFGPAGATASTTGAAYIVFDAHTGNQLAMGIGARTPPLG